MRYLFLEIYWAEGSIRGQYIDNTHYFNLRREYPRYFNLSNNQVTYLFVVSADTVSNADAAAFAKNIATGRVVHRHIDLSQIGRANYTNSGYSKKVSRGR